MFKDGPKNAVLLAAGSGTRLAPLTNTTHKSLLPIGGTPVLELIIDAILAAGINDVVVVTGHRSGEIESFVSSRYGELVRCVLNSRYKEDVNILSVDIGVDALYDPSAVYMIIETDLIIEPSGWRKILDVGKGHQSFWVTSGRYAPNLTGGCLLANPVGKVEEIVYRPQYDSRCEGWQKLLGILYVGSDSVEEDRKLRKLAMGRTISQYYMMPWVENIDLLPCFARDLEESYAVSFNDIHAYLFAQEQYTKIINMEKP